MKKIFAFLVTILFSSTLISAEIEQTLSIIKPEAVAEHHIGEINTRIEKAGLSIVATKMMKLEEKTAQEFYASCKDRSFYPDLVKYMRSGPILVQVLEGPDAIATYRLIMGPTDPKKAEKGTIRGTFGKDIQHNAVHGSDSKENAQKEIAFFFAQDEIFSQNTSK